MCCKPERPDYGMAVKRLQLKTTDSFGDRELRAYRLEMAVPSAFGTVVNARASLPLPEAEGGGAETASLDADAHPRDGVGLTLLGAFGYTWDFWQMRFPEGIEVEGGGRGR